MDLAVDRRAGSGVVDGRGRAGVRHGDGDARADGVVDGRAGRESRLGERSALAPPLVCDGAGVAPVEGEYDWQEEPPCGYKYQWRSSPERTGGAGTWPLTVTARWNVTWTATTGETGDGHPDRLVDDGREGRRISDLVGSAGRRLITDSRVRPPIWSSRRSPSCAAAMSCSDRRLGLNSTQNRPTGKKTQNTARRNDLVQPRSLPRMLTTRSPINDLPNVRPEIAHPAVR